MKLKLVTCDRTCGFLIRSANENEIIEFVEMHFKKNHQMKLTDNDVRGKIRRAYNHNH